ncbi:MAG: hypothetical protein K9K88_18665 [Desulfobacterales bacterium]|nr:hypothetical protein [Desulfobacterales bacterium]
MTSDNPCEQPDDKKRIPVPLMMISKKKAARAADDELLRKGGVKEF